jgi:hypothetical protein
VTRRAQTEGAARRPGPGLVRLAVRVEMVEANLAPPLAAGEPRVPNVDPRVCLAAALTSTHSHETLPNGAALAREGCGRVGSGDGREAQ